MLVGGPDFLERVMEGVALAMPHKNKNTANREGRKMIG
jgi:hypothetical protein